MPIPKKSQKTEKKVEKKASKKKEEKQRGRQAGMVYSMPEEYLEPIEEGFAEIKDAIEDANSCLKKIRDKGSKAACKDMRAYLQVVGKSIKDLRKAIQEGKESIEAKPEKKAKKSKRDDDDDD